MHLYFTDTERSNIMAIRRLYVAVDGFLYQGYASQISREQSGTILDLYAGGTRFESAPDTGYPLHFGSEIVT
jgi:hypothetical protein